MLPKAFFVDIARNSRNNQKQNMIELWQNKKLLIFIPCSQNSCQYRNCYCYVRLRS